VAVPQPSRSSGCGATPRERWSAHSTDWLRRCRSRRRAPSTFCRAPPIITWERARQVLVFPRTIGAVRALHRVVQRVLHAIDLNRSWPLVLSLSKPSRAFVGPASSHWGRRANRFEPRLDDVLHVSVAQAN
jgi:hypothetical protein